MAEDVVRREIVGRVHEVRLLGRLLARAADSAFGVADDAVIEVDQTGAQQRREREDDRSRVAAWVRDEASVGDLGAMQFGAAEDGFRL